MLAAVDGEFEGNYAVYLKCGTVARLLSEDPEWNGKIGLLCDQFERGPNGRALPFLDDALAEILDGGSAVQALMGSQADLGSALRNMTLLSYGACSHKGGRNSVLPRLNQVMARVPPNRSRQTLAGRVERALKSVAPLTRENPKVDSEIFVNLIGMLCGPAGFLGGPGMSEAVTQRARLCLAGVDGDLTPEETLRKVQSHLPNRAVRLGYLLDLAHSPFGHKNMATVLKSLVDLLGELPDLAALMPSGASPDQQRAIIGDLRRRMEGEAMPADIRDMIARRLERLMTGEKVMAEEAGISLAATPPPARPAGPQMVRIDDQDLPRRDLAIGEILFRQGDPGDEAYLVVSGEIDIFVGNEDKERIISTVRRGDIIGEMAVLTHQPRQATARAKTKATLIAVPAEAFRARLDRLAGQDRVLRRLIDVFAERLRVGIG
ncbi:MAG: cyclic nucleotide-binding domain-containing protein [Alphaproteobacteria bacterium]|nr:cyclic nucleotide-binding domain-containing protein [Alphaproteobacteria bacterium]